ncbi:MAG TPA: hypothetical protein VN366_08670 [Feifaniaceae bacterium]|nr:hypothetical protein [Feifaniaceae bacterium]
MTYVLLGVLSFVPFMLFDVKKARGARYAFFWYLAGALMLFVSTAALMKQGFAAEREPWRDVFGVFAAVWIAVYLYVLFGALPAKKAYGEEKRPAVIKTGPYALCRHPGGWCFLLLYVCLYLFSGGYGMLLGAVLFPALNFFVIWVEDTYLFPRYIAGYADYKREVPFLLPNRRSIGAFLNKP